MWKKKTKIEVPKLCLYDDHEHRITCVLAKKVDIEIGKTEKIRDELLNNNVLYRLHS